MEKIKKIGKQFANDRPGERFINLHRTLHSGGHKVLVSIAGVVGGVVLMIGGLILGFIPGVPGVVLGVLGLALIAAQIPILAKWCDRWEPILRGVLKKCRAAISRNKNNPPIEEKPLELK